MRYFYLLSACLLAFLMFGCADSSTKGNVKEVAADIRIEIHDNTGPIYLDPALGFEYAQGDTTQDTAGTSSINPATTLKIPIAQGGSTSAVEGAMKGVKSLLDTSLKDSNNSSSPVIPAPESPSTKPNIITPPTDNTLPIVLDGERITLQKSDNNKMFNWLDVSGATLNRPLTFTFPECEFVLSVPDSAKAWGADGNAENYNQSYYFSGNPELQRDTNMSCPGGCASVFAPPDCPASYVIMK